LGHARSRNAPSHTHADPAAAAPQRQRADRQHPSPVYNGTRENLNDCPFGTITGSESRCLPVRLRVAVG
ncbi:MAG: hypothetical protein LC790_07150, partial [Actinobacteria bacterium]|nr:hypothetical protein [Actinomycetota bacterium]